MLVSVIHLRRDALARRAAAALARRRAAFVRRVIASEWVRDSETIRLEAVKAEKKPHGHAEG
jgi:hypothetical protein